LHTRPSPPRISPLSLPDALPIWLLNVVRRGCVDGWYRLGQLRRERPNLCIGVTWMAGRQGVRDRDVHLAPRQRKPPVIELVQIMLAVPHQQPDQLAQLIIAEPHEDTI